jgi:hypothetical protein
MIVVFDTNIWREHSFLKSPAAAAVRFFLRQERARVALPEVIRLEVERHLRAEIQKRKTRIREDHERLLTVFGSLKELVLPTDQEVDRILEKAFDGLGVEIIDIPFSLESARSSLLKVIDHVPPNSENDQQFKDGVIWAECVQLLKSDDVVLLSTDRGFYESRNYDNGIAASLKAETDGLPHKLRIAPRLIQLLQEIQKDVNLPEGFFAREAISFFENDLRNLVEGAGFTLGPLKAAHPMLFATENANELFIEFELTFECIDSTELNRPPAELIAKGEGIYYMDSKGLGYFRLREELLTYLSEDGRVMRIGTHRTSATIHVGHKSVTRTTRERIN